MGAYSSLSFLTGSAPSLCGDNLRVGFIVQVPAMKVIYMLQKVGFNHTSVSVRVPAIRFTDEVITEHVNQGHVPVTIRSVSQVEFEVFNATRRASASPLIVYNHLLGREKGGRDRLMLFSTHQCPEMFADIALKNSK